MDTMKLRPHHITDVAGLKIDGVEITPSAAEINDAAEFIYISGETGELTTVIGDAVTLYSNIIRAPVAMSLISIHVRTEAKETTANATVDVLKAASGTAITSGTAMVTQIDPDTFTDATDEALAVLETGAEDLAAGDMVAIKVVSGAATSTLKHLAYTAKFQRNIA